LAVGVVGVIAVAVAVAVAEILICFALWFSLPLCRAKADP
jgi:hypothetical protein